jgi:hypothetical protein
MKIAISAVVFFMVLALSSCTATRQPNTRDFYGLTLVNNSQAKDATSAELIQFLKQDKTDKHFIIPYTHKLLLPYSMSPDAEDMMYFNKDGDAIGGETLHDYVISGYQCVNFAIDLHNSAEQAGIRCAMVTLIILKPNVKIGHCFNAFKTTDMGIVYVDASAGTDNLAYTDAKGDLFIDCPVTKGIGDSYTEILGNPENFKVEW